MRIPIEQIKVGDEVEVLGKWVEVDGSFYLNEAIYSIYVKRTDDGYTKIDRPKGTLITVRRKPEPPKRKRIVIETEERQAEANEQSIAAIERRRIRIMHWGTRSFEKHDVVTSITEEEL